MEALRMGYAALDPFICSDARRLAESVAGAAGVWCADGWTKSDVARRAGHEGGRAVLCGIGLSDLEPELSGDEAAAGGVFIAGCPFLVCVSERERRARAGAGAPVC